MAKELYTRPSRVVKANGISTWWTISVPLVTLLISFLLALRLVMLPTPLMDVDCVSDAYIYIYVSYLYNTNLMCDDVYCFFYLIRAINQRDSALEMQSESIVISPKSGLDQQAVMPTKCSP